MLQPGVPAVQPGELVWTFTYAPPVRMAETNESNEIGGSSTVVPLVPVASTPVPLVQAGWGAPVPHRLSRTGPFAPAGATWMWATTAFVMPLTFTVYWICWPLIVRVADPVASVVIGGTSLAPLNSAVKLVAGLDGSSLQADTTREQDPGGDCENAETVH